MEYNGLTVVESSRRMPWKRIVALLVLIVMLGFGTYYIATAYTIRDIEIAGNTTYTSGEITSEIKKEAYVPNVVIMILENRIFHPNYLPFLQDVTMSFSNDTHVLHVKVTEKLRAGVFEYMDRYVYFNSDGKAVESRRTLLEGIPVVTGVSFDKLVLGEKIPASKKYFSRIVDITKMIATYDLDISEIHFDALDDITLVSGKYKIYLGTTDYLDKKMSRITSIINALEKKKYKGTIDMHLVSAEKDTITFKKSKK